MSEFVIKTGKEWLETMPEEVKKKYLTYVVTINSAGFLEYKLRERATLYNFVVGSFVFSYTTEGSGYWMSIANGNYEAKPIKKSMWSKFVNLFKK